MLNKSLSALIAAVMVCGNAFGVTVYADNGEDSATGSASFEGIALTNSDMSFDIWGDDAGWKVDVDDWDGTGASIKSFEYSSDEWMNKPSDESNSGVNFWFGNGDGVLTFAQDVELEAGDYTLTAEAKGQGAEFLVSAADNDGDKTSLTGYNNWLSTSIDFTVEETEAVSVKTVFEVSKDGWGYLNSIKWTRGTGAMSFR